jgi:hypothetical protein
MRKKELIPLAKLVAEDNRFKKALQREFPKLAKLVQSLIDESPKSPVSKSLEIELKKMKKILFTPPMQHGRLVRGLFVELQEHEQEK